MSQSAKFWDASFRYMLLSLTVTSKLPKVKDLNVEYAQVLEGKKKAYAEYHKSKEEMQEFLRARKNIEHFLENDARTEKEEQKGKTR